MLFLRMQYFEQQLQLLKKERDEDRQLYSRAINTSSLAERRANGITWYPIVIKGSEPTRGDYVSIEVERTGNKENQHYFRFGSGAALFSNHDAKINRVEGIVTYQSLDRLKLTLYIDELPDWVRDGKLGIDLLFDERSYEEMENALKQASKVIENEKTGHLIKVLTGERAAAFENIDPGTYPNLNLSQQAAVNKILSAKDLAIIHGPPGTGKTTTIVQAVKAMVKNTGEQILMVAPSNTAVDLLSEKLADQGLNVVRVGNPERISEKLMDLTLDHKIDHHPRNKEIKKLKKQAAEYKNMAHKYKRSFGKAEREQRKALFNEAHQVMQEADRLEQFIVNDLVEKAQVITATLVGSNHYTIKDLKFYTVVIDEAGQALEPASWIPILKAQKVVLAGDHFQLPPTIKSQEAARDGLNTTLLEKCVNAQSEAVVLLEEQYRMNKVIMGFSSNKFYQGRLKSAKQVAEWTLFPGDEPLLFIDTAGCGFDEKLEGTSTTNPEEAGFLFKHLSETVELLKTQYTVETFPSIAIISPYQEQVRILKELKSEQADFEAYQQSIAVNTIDSFQGQERDVVYISMTRSNTKGEIGFLSDIRRMNVAMTRAKKKLIVIGDSSTLAQFGFYKDFISYAESVGGYHSAWEYLNS